MLTSNIDKDVNIADISTSDKLGVTIDRGSAPWLENLMGQTNELLKQVVTLLSQSQPQLTQGLSKLDTSIDDLIAAETGESVMGVQTRQGIEGEGSRPGGANFEISQPKRKTPKKRKEKETKSD